MELCSTQLSGTQADSGFTILYLYHLAHVVSSYGGCSWGFCCVHAKSLQLCPTLCNTMDCSPPGSSLHGILLARILEQVAMMFSSSFSQPRDQTCISYVSCIGRWILYPYYTQGSLHNKLQHDEKYWVPVSYLYKCLLSTYYVPGIVLGTEDRMLRKSSFVEITVK